MFILDKVCSLGIHSGMPKTRVLFLVPLLFCSCANQTFYTPGKNAKGGDVAIKAFSNSGDMVGNVEMSPGHVSVRLPDGPIPYAEVTRTDAKGNTTVSRVPVMPGIYNSTVNNGNWAGAAKLVDSATRAAAAGVLGAGLGAIPK